MTLLPSTAPLRTQTPSTLPRLSQSKNSQPPPKPSKSTNLTFSTKSSPSKTSSDPNPKKQPRPTPQRPHRRASHAIPSPTYIPLAKMQARMTRTKVLATTSTANARAKTQPSFATRSFPLALNFGTFLTARITPRGVEGRAGIAYGVGCA